MEGIENAIAIGDMSHEEFMKELDRLSPEVDDMDAIDMLRAASKEAGEVAFMLNCDPPLALAMTEPERVLYDRLLTSLHLLHDLLWKYA